MNFKLIGNATSAAAKAGWLSKVFSGAKTLMSGAGKFLSNPWVSAAFLGWEVYDYFSDDDKEGEDVGGIIADVGRAKDVTKIMYPPSVLRALTNQISDSSAMSNAFTAAFLKAASSSDSLARLRTASYACAAHYLMAAPDVNNIIYSPDKTAAALSELSTLIADELDESDASSVKGLDLTAKDISSAPIESRRVLDFTAHLVTNFKKELTAEQ